MAQKPLAGYVHTICIGKKTRNRDADKPYSLFFPSVIGGVFP